MAKQHPTGPQPTQPSKPSSPPTKPLSPERGSEQKGTPRPPKR